MKKMCLILFSSNRLEYLKPTLKSFSMLDFEGIQVEKFFVDDYPLGRNDEEILDLVKSYGFDFAIMHKENKGITATWTEMWDLLKNQDYDYCMLHEDDAVHTKKVKVMDLIQLLEENPSLSQVQFGRDVWYDHEEQPDPKKHKQHKQYKWEVGGEYFWMMSSICSMDVVNLDIKAKTGYDLAEGVIAWFMRTEFNKLSAIIRDHDYSPLIDHIGEYFQGRRISQKGDPGWDKMGTYQVGIKYCSKTGKILSNDVK